MKVPGVVFGAVLAVIGGLNVLPTITIFAGVTFAATIICYLLCNNMDSDFKMVERVLIALLVNIVGAFVLVWVLPSTFGNELGFQYVLLACVAAGIGTIIGAVLTEYYRPWRR